MSAPWSTSHRPEALARAERDGVELLVIGGGITGAGVLRDAASRGMRALLVERDDFASGTSSRSSKMIHGGMRYIGEGQLALTRQACRERDLLVRHNPHLVQRIPFLFPAYEDSKLPLWQVRTALWVYSALANFRRSSRFRMLDPEEVAAFSPDLCQEGLRGAGLFWDAQVDDARLVLETLRSARELGGEAVNHAEVVEFLRAEDGRLRGARVRDSLRGRTHEIRAESLVNAAGPGVERLRGLDRPVSQPELRPAKGIHLVIPRRRIQAEGAITFEASDRRHVFLAPWGEVAMLGTTDRFSDEIDEPVVTIDEVHYLLAAANAAFPRAALTTNDLRSVFAGVRPLLAPRDATQPPSSVSREHRLYEDPSGLISMAGGKLTTYRAMGEEIVDRILRRWPRARRRRFGASRTASLPLRQASFDAPQFEAELVARFGLAPWRASHLVRTYGSDAEPLLRAVPPEWREPIGASRFVYAEIPWSFEHESPAGLCDLLERRMRMAIFAEGQGLPELARIAAIAGEALGWDEEHRREEAAAYVTAVRHRYQIQAGETGRARSAA